MIRLTLVLGVVTLVLLACSASPTTTPPVPEGTPPGPTGRTCRLGQGDGTGQHHAGPRPSVGLAGRVLRVRTQRRPSLRSLLCGFPTGGAGRDRQGYAAILQYAALTEQVYQEAFGQPMTDEQRAEYLDYWTYTITSLQSLVKPTERMLRDFGCVQ